ncbi:glycosyltransferase family 39 protein [bacterium]|nr:glycosyltransferase family 39 protein [bacterium]
MQNDEKHNPLISKWGIIVTLIILCGCGVFLRFWNLGTQSLWVDETNALYAAQDWLSNGTLTLPSGFPYHRGLVYTYLTAFVFKGLGVSEQTVRFPAAFFGFLSILLSYFVAARIFSKKVGLLTAFLVTFSHFEVGWSRTAKMYTLLQCSTLVFMYAFIRAFEANTGNRKLVESQTSKKSPFQRLGLCLREWHISPFWMVMSILVFGISYLYIHRLILFLMAGVFFYFAWFAFLHFFEEKNLKKVINKYSIMMFSMVLGLGFIWIVFPYLQDAIHYFLSYTPSWATGESSAQNKLFLFEFLISSQRFPIAAFFFIGSFQLFSHQNKLGWIPFWLFICPLFLLSFLFTHRVPTYILFVYPLFLTISAFGFVNLLESEFIVLRNHLLLKREWMKQAIVTLLFLVFVISPWFRITLNIPFYKDGANNSAVTTQEWREASKRVIDHKQADDVIISSLPQVALYYGLHSDYVLNWASLIQSREEQYYGDTGREIDIYSGTVIIQSLNELEEIINTNPHGYILVGEYDLNHVNYIPEDIKTFILNSFEEPLETENGSIFIYRWMVENGT